jgi:SAM-dependent methyltransferase
MAGEKLVLPENAQKLFGRKSILLGKGSFEKYKVLVEADKTTLPFKALAKGDKGVLLRGLEMTLSNIDSEKSGQAFKELSSHAIRFANTRTNTKDDLIRLENELRGMLEAIIPDYRLKLDKALESRSDSVFKSIAPYLEGGSILDIGTGNGMVAKLIHDRTKMHVEIMDVLDYNRSGLPLTVYDGRNIPFGTGQFDMSLVGMVYHHADHPVELIAETARVTKKRAIVIESISLNQLHRSTQAFVDWFYNRVLNKNVNCPFNFQTPAGWRDTFAKLGFIVSGEIHLGIDMPLAPEYHVLYLLDKK